MKILNFNILLFLVVGFFFFACNEDETLGIESLTDVELRQVIRTEDRSIFPCDARNLTITIDDCLDEFWVQGIMDAINELNNLGGVAIHIRELTDEEISDGEEPDIPFKCSDSECHEFLGLFWPSIRIGFARFEGTIELTDVSEILDCCNGLEIIRNQECFFKGVILHEILHVLGFQHDHDFVDNVRSDLVVVPGTPETDPNSIMIGNDGCTPRCELSEFDIIALQHLYGPCECPDAVGTCSCPNETTDFCECAPESYEFKLVPGNTICEGELSKLFLIPTPPSNINPQYDWSFSGAVTGNGSGSSASFVGNLNSNKPLGGICLTLTTDCEQVTFCENVHVIECD